MSAGKYIKGYYYCRSCHSIYYSAVGGSSRLNCTKCKDTAAEGGIAASGARYKTAPKKVRKRSKEPSAYTGRSRSKKSKPRNPTFSLAVIAFIILLGCGALFFFKGGDQNVSANITEEDTSDSELAIDAYNKKKLKEALPECLEALKSFVSAKETVDKTLHVYQGSRLAYKMEKYYAANPTLIGSITVEAVKSSIYNEINDHSLVDIVFTDDSGDLKEIAFIKEDGEWKLDWESYVRYSSMSWFRFVNTEEAIEGEFRLYIKKFNFGSEFEEEYLTFQLYPPSANVNKKISGRGAQRILLPLSGPHTSILNQLSQDVDNSEEHSFTDPAGYARVNLKLRLDYDEKNQPSIELLDILATHWRGVSTSVEETASGLESGE